MGDLGRSADILKLTFVIKVGYGVDMTLAALPHRTTARIRSVAGDRAFRRRLLELGFLPGTDVTIMGAAPMGDPLDIQIRGCRFSIRKAEADAVGVEPA